MGGFFVAKRWWALIFAIGFGTAIAGYRSSSGGEERVLVATTTSLYDTGLLDSLARKVFRDTGLEVKFVPAGSGFALRSGERGDVDAVIIHAPAEEMKFLQEGWGVNRKVIAYNFFLIVGPGLNPAGIRDLSPIQALRAIRMKGEEGGVTWVSRADGSGTHIKERALWAEAGIDSEAIRRERWYLESGSGMSSTLQLANEKLAYTLSDGGTFLKLSRAGIISLVPMVQAGKELLNVYSVIAVNPRKHPKANFEEAMKLIHWLSSDRGQDFIRRYGEKEYGAPLFYPVVDLPSTDGQVSSWIRDYAYFEGTECPPRYRYRDGNLYGPEG